MSRVPSDTLRLIGVVVRPHGIRGDLVLRPESDDPKRVLGLQTVYVGASADAVRPFVVRSARTHIAGGHHSLLIGLDTIDDRDAAAAVVGVGVYADEADLPPRSDHEVFLDSLLGMTAITPTSTVLGEVIDVLEAPGQDLLKIQTVAGGEALVPLVPALVSKIDTEHRTVTIEPLEGLIEAAD